MCNRSRVKMEQGAKGLSRWHVASHQFTEETEKSMSILDVSSSPGSSAVHTSWNHGPSGIQHVPRCTELERVPLVSAEAPRQNAREMGPHFSMLLPDHSVSPQVTFTPSQMIYSGNVSFPARNDDFPGAPSNALRRAQYSRGGHDLWWESKDAPQWAASLTCQWNPNDVPHQNVNNALFWPPNSNF